ncbi:MAG: phenylalanine--tRNA ligase subunit beta [Bacteroidia bacterium]|jgi:phenylalanyl-tRNA synthetase beta chain|nr:phenylalanine--tRNA ligase subunit beta [Bacteroidia bacterium]
MKIAYNWLLELIKMDKSPAQIAEILTGTGLEVESIESFESIKGALKGIVVGEVLTCEKHPNADKLRITTVNIGTGSPLQIVCGAPNVAVGQKVLVATVGSKIYPTQGEPFTINKSKIRGEVSEGMICAEDELGLGESHAGIMVLPIDCEVGKNANTYFPTYSDYTIEIGLTANRGDAASHLGVARDLRAVTGIPIQLPEISSQIPDTVCPITITLNDTDCKRYAGLVIEGVMVKPSPSWLQNKLKTIGLNPINNIVDATNYVLHTLGQPLHAFDLAKISGQSIIVQKAAKGTRFVTLDKVERTLLGHELMICDSQKPLAIAGVFGGLDSGITENTSAIFVESAYFDAASIRKTAKAHGLSTDASFRYERGTDPEMVVYALKLVAQLIVSLSGGSITSGISDIYPTPIAPINLPFSVQRFTKLIGQDIPLETIKTILTNLDIQVKEDSTADLLNLVIPAYRSDVTREADIAEEILRIYGLNQIAIPAQVKSSVTPTADDFNYQLRNRAANFLSNSGFYELVSNSLSKSAYYTDIEQSQTVVLRNPLSQDLDTLRFDMLYSGLETLQYNHNRKVQHMKCFELGYTYQKIGDKFTETPHLTLWMYGNHRIANWNTAAEPMAFHNLKAVVLKLLKHLGIPEKLDIDYDATHKHLYQAVSISKSKHELVTFGIVKPEIAEHFDLNDPVFVADFNWSSIRKTVAEKQLKFKPISAYPHVRRDLALLIEEHVSYAQIEKIAYKTVPNKLQSMDAFDVYQGDKIQSGKKSYAISFVLQDNEKTLTDAEIDQTMSALIHAFEKELGATLRA